MNDIQTSSSALGSYFKRAATVFKLLGVFVLILILLIPLSMIRSVLTERLNRRNDALAEITSTWGNEQLVVGPVLVIPYRYTFTEQKQQYVNGKLETVETTSTAMANAYFLPDELTVDGSVEPKRLHRGIYQAVVYGGDLKVEGRFSKPEFKLLKVEEKDVLWDETVVTLAVTDMRGTQETLHLTWGTDSIPLLPGSKLGFLPSGIHARVPVSKGGETAMRFAMELTFNGSSALRFAPVAKDNHFHIASPWPDPSFRGAFLPTDRRITADGFDAHWKISYYGRGYAQQWTDRESSAGMNSGTIQSSLFGVAFLDVVDAYRNVERSIKYGVLFLVLIFAMFFLFEMLAAMRLHTFQYTLVGTALCLFYLALLSLSELIAFPFAYLAASSAATVMISLYCLAVLKSGKRTLIVSVGLASIYAFLYLTLQLQDYSLLFGTAGLFLVLAIVMYATRKVDWYARDKVAATPAPPPILPRPPQ